MTGTNEISLQGKTAIVTGAARSIGLATAELLARAGAKVALVDLQEAQVRAAARKLSAEGFSALALTADVSNREQVSAAVAEVVNTWGGVDILVNNAGICPVTPAEEISEAEWDRVLAVNLKGAFLFCQAVMPVMRRQRAGKIVNMSSSAGQTGGIIAGLHYSASKAGLIGLTRSLARLLAPDIQVNAVAPGTVVTAMTRELLASEEGRAMVDAAVPMPLNGHSEPIVIARLLAWLTSEENTHKTGQTIYTAGGAGATATFASGSGPGASG